MILSIRPEALRRLGQGLASAADEVSAQAAVLDHVGAGRANFGLGNQFMTPTLALFVVGGRHLARECAEQLREGALAAHDTALDMQQTDSSVGRRLGGGADT